jgi:hypothetical protein
MSKYKVLLFDDCSQVRVSLEEIIISNKMEVIPCRTIYEANDAWEDNKDIDAIVLDMMIPSSGLDDDLRLLTKGGLLSGWIWLWRILNPDNVVPHPALGKCIVIYSGYLDDFSDYIESVEPSSKEKEFVKHVKLIPKGFTDENEKKVIEFLTQDREQKR